MKPYISEILEHNGKTYRLPIPAKYRELIDCVRTLGIKTVEDEGDMRVIGYETLCNLPAPDINESRYLVELIAKETSGLTPEQVTAISAVCDKFDVEYMSIGHIINIIKKPKGTGGTS